RVRRRWLRQAPGGRAAGVHGRGVRGLEAHARENAARLPAEAREARELPGIHRAPRPQYVAGDLFQRGVMEIVKLPDRTAFLAGSGLALATAAAIAIGSTSMRHFDPALTGYAIGALMAAFAVGYRFAVWAQ